MEHKFDTSATRVEHECYTQRTRVQHECYTNDTRATRVKHFDFDNDTSENIFFTPYISYIANDRLQGEEQFHSKNYLLEKPRSYQNAFEKCSTKTELCNAKSYVKKLNTTTMDKILDKLQF